MLLLTMNYHENVSCNACLEDNFTGRRYKCLQCYNYDLCSLCYDANAINSGHNRDHPMQCILTKADFILYYGGEEILPSPTSQQSYTCAYCSRMGFTVSTLQEHVVTDHVNTFFEVICPVCVTAPGGNPNYITNDFASHLTLEHCSGPRDLLSFIDEPVPSLYVRRIPLSGYNTARRRGSSSFQSVRSRRHSVRVNVISTRDLGLLPTSSGDSSNPLTRIISHLSEARRPSSNTSTSTGPSRLQLLQMQLNQAQARMESMDQIASDPIIFLGSKKIDTPKLQPTASVQQSPATLTSTPTVSANFLLPALLEELSFQDTTDNLHSDRSQFVQQLMLSTLLHPKERNEEEEKD